MFKKLQNTLIIIGTILLLFVTFSPSDAQTSSTSNASVYFSAQVPAFGYELWQYTNGSATLVADIWQGENSSDPAWLTIFNGDLYFAATSPELGRELWVYDTDSQIASIIDLAPGVDSTNPTWLTVYNDLLCFAGEIPDFLGRELWCFDGINAQSFDVVIGIEESNPTDFIVFDNSLYFAGDLGVVLGREMISFDGTSFEAHDILIGIDSGEPTYPVIYDDQLYFALNSGSQDYGRELASFNPDNNSTQFFDINLGENNGNPTDLVVFDGKLYFSAFSSPENGGSGRELWVFTSNNGFEPTIDINTITETAGTASSSVGWITIHDNRLYFVARSNAEVEQALWVYDPNSGIAEIAADINTGTGDADIRWITSTSNGLMINAYSNPSQGGSGAELWMYYEDTLVADLLADIWSGADSSNPIWLSIQP